MTDTLMGVTDAIAEPLAIASLVLTLLASIGTLSSGSLFLLSSFTEIPVTLVRRTAWQVVLITAALVAGMFGAGSVASSWRYRQTLVALALPCIIAAWLLLALLIARRAPTYSRRRCLLVSAVACAPTLMIVISVSGIL